MIMHSHAYHGLFHVSLVELGKRERQLPYYFQDGSKIVHAFEALMP